MQHHSQNTTCKFYPELIHCTIGRSFGVVLWELLTCEIPYRDVDNSAIIYGVGSSSLQLPIPSTCPDGFRLIVQMCWNSKPRNRPSFKYILMHLDIAAVEIRSTPPDTYYKTQVRRSRVVSGTYLIFSLY